MYSFWPVLIIFAAFVQCALIAQLVLPVAVLLFLFAPRLVHIFFFSTLYQRLLTMSKTTSLQNTLSVQHLVATHGVVDCLSKSFQKFLLSYYLPKQECKVCIPTHPPTTHNMYDTQYVRTRGCCRSRYLDEWALHFLRSTHFEARHYTNLKQDDNVHVHIPDTNDQAFHSKVLITHMCGCREKGTQYIRAPCCRICCLSSWSWAAFRQIIAAVCAHIYGLNRSIARECLT